MHRRLLEAIPDSATQGLDFYRSQSYFILTSNSIGQRIEGADRRPRGNLYGEVGDHRPSIAEFSPKAIV